VPIRTFQYRLYPSPAQEKYLQLLLDVSRNVYNMALEERKLAWELKKQSLGRADSERLAKAYKNISPSQNSS
jgi:putative transposase